MGSLTFRFHGVCAHFLNVVPFVPHRVVLPDASALRFGIIDVPAGETEVVRFSYFLMPHLPILRTHDANQSLLEVPSVMQQGNIYSTVRLQVANATGSGLAYDTSWLQIPRFTEYVADYMWSEDVVLYGRAACYLDLFTGTVSKTTDEHGAAAVQVVMQTDGFPLLRVTPFVLGEASSQLIQLSSAAPDVVVDVANQGFDCTNPESSNDFLLQFLTNRSGIPPSLLNRTPGMPTFPGSYTQESIDTALDKLKTLDYPNRFSGSCFAPQGGLGQLSPACSDVRYP